MYNILIVEDEEIERRVLKSIIEDNIQGVNVVGEAKNGKEAIPIIDNLEIDLAFMDINLPGMNGLEIIDYLKRRRPKSKVIIITAYDKFEIAHTAIKLKVDDYLLKPVKPNVLVEIIKKYIQDTNKNKIEDEYKDYIYQLRESIHNNSYKKSIEVIKNYIDRLYSSVDFDSIVLESLVLFGKGIIDIAEDMGLNNHREIEIKVNEITNSNLYNRKRCSLYNEFRSILDDIYLDLDNKKENTEKGIDSLLNYIEMNIREGITLEDLANYSNRNVYYLSKLFKKEMGVNFIDYLTDRKMETAKEMLEDPSIPIKRISIELAYNEPNYFSKVFKKNVGVTPSQYREKITKKNSGL